MTRFKFRATVLGLAAMAVLAAPAAALAGDDAQPAGWTYNQSSGWTYNPGTAVQPTRSNTSSTPTYSGGWQYQQPVVAGGTVDPCLLLNTCP